MTWDVVKTGSRIDCDDDYLSVFLLSCDLDATCWRCQAGRACRTGILWTIHRKTQISALITATEMTTSIHEGT